MAITSDQMEQKVDKAYVNMTRFDSIVNGTDTQEVTTDNGPVPSVAKFFKDLGDTVLMAGTDGDIKDEDLPPRLREMTSLISSGSILALEKSGKYTITSAVTGTPSADYYYVEVTNGVDGYPEYLLRNLNTGQVWRGFTVADVFSGWVHVDNLKDYAVEQFSDLATVPKSVNIVRTSCHNLLSKLGGALYRKSETAPAHGLYQAAVGGGYWVLSDPQIDACMAGMVPGGSYDNGTAFADLFEYGVELGAGITIPPGQFLTSTGASMRADGAKKVPSVRGSGPATSMILLTPGDGKIAMDFDYCARLSLANFGVYKSDGGATVDDSIGVRIRRSPWMIIDHLSTEEGFDCGLRLRNVLSSDIRMHVARNNHQYGLYADYQVDGSEFVSRPNALKIHGEYGLNGRWGVRIDEPGLVDFTGIIEGNGREATGDFRGGMYISNAGTEAGVGINIRSTYFEVNAGRANLYIAQAINSDTYFSLDGCSFAAFDMTHYVQNDIYVENNTGVRVNLGLAYNKFENAGSYTPDASRRCIVAANPDLVSVNLTGKRQFLNAVEYPTDFGSMGQSFGGRVLATGAASNMPDGWSCSKTGTGSFQITPPTQIQPYDFAFVATTLSPDTVHVERAFQSGVTWLVLIVDGSGTPADGQFTWAALPIR